MLQKTFISLLILGCFGIKSGLAQDCSASGNVAIFSNYEGGELIIDVNQNIPDLKIGIAAYEPTAVTFTGAFVGNITEVIYAGYQPSSPGNNSCGTVNLVNVDAPAGITPEILNTPPVTLTSPDVELFPGFFLPAGDNSGITGCSSCDNDSYQGGSNTAEQVIDYFLTQFGGELLFLKTQYSCWCGTQDLNQPPTCCFVQTNEENVFIQAIPSASLCDAPITLDAGPGYDSYSWIPNGESTQTIEVTVSGLYSVNVESECGNANDEIFIEPCEDELQVILNDQTVCAGEEVEIFAEVIGGTAPYSFAWIPDYGTGPGPYSVTFAANTTIDLTVTDATGLSAEASAQITVENEPVVYLGPDQNLCSEFIILSSPSSVGTLVWSTDEEGSEILVGSPGTYSASLENVCGIATDEITISECPEELEITLDDGEICLGESFELLAVAAGGVEPYSFDWEPAFSDSPGPFVVTPNSTVTYTVTVTDAEGSTASATAEVTVIEEDLTIDLGPNQELCDGSLILDASNADAIIYTWSTEEFSPQITVTEPGTYSVTLNGLCGVFTDEITVVECNGLLIELEDQTICNGETTQIQAVVSGGTPPYEITWDPPLGENEGPYDINPSFDQGYTIFVTDSEGETSSETVLVEVLPSELEITLADTTAICPDETVTLDATTESATGYVWSTGATTPTLTLGSKGSYSVEVSSACANASATTVVELLPGLPEGLIANQSLLTCESNFPLEIGLTENEDYNLIWSTGDLTDRIQVPAAGVYVADVSTICREATLVWEVKSEDCECEIFVPNAFTPNMDGLNDSFRPKIECDLKKYELTIWNRWGNLVFETDEMEDVWRGESPDENFFGGINVYFWKLEVEQDLESIVPETIKRQGSVTVIR